MTADPGLKQALLRKSSFAPQIVLFHDRRPRLETSFAPQISRVSRYVDKVPILSLFDRTATCVVTGHNEKPKAQEKKEK